MPAMNLPNGVADFRYQLEIHRSCGLDSRPQDKNQISEAGLISWQGKAGQLTRLCPMRELRDGCAQ